MTDTIEFEGVALIVDLDAEIKPGDTYLAKRNTGWKLLTCKEVKYQACLGEEKCFAWRSPHNKEKGHPDYIIPVEWAYPFDAWECYKVVGGL